MVFELSISPYKYASDILHLDVFNGIVENAPYSEESFDFVLMLDLIEHLPDIPRSMSKIKSLLKPNGLILIQVPWELYHWEKRLEAFFRGMKVGTIRPDAIPVHLYFFTPDTLIKVLQKCGLNIVSQQSGNYGRIRGKINPMIFDAPDPFKSLLQKLFYKFGLRVMMRKAAPLFKMGSGIILFCKKS